MDIIIQDYMNKVETVATLKSIEKVGELSYPYAFGYMHSFFAYTLDELKLSKRQLKILQKRFED